MSPDPLRLLRDDRKRAASLNDPLCDRCFLATVNDHGNPEVRTLVLRDVDGHLGFFANGSSPKCLQFQNSSTVAIVLYFESVAIQYRIHTELSSIASTVVHRMWRKRPDIAKKLDRLYESFRQSSPLQDPKEFRNRIDQTSVPNDAPDTALGFFFDPIHTIERLALAMPGGIHKRTLYLREGHFWQEQFLVP